MWIDDLGQIEVIANLYSWLAVLPLLPKHESTQDCPNCTLVEYWKIYHFQQYKFFQYQYFFRAHA